MNQFIDHISQSQFGLQPFPDRLYVVTAISNPCRYLSRYNLYRAFEKRCADGGAILYTVEQAFGDRPFEITDAKNPRHIQLRSLDELWHKENMLNIGINRLPPEARYIAWIDADVTFLRPDWAQETLQQLQHHHVVQMFSQSVDLGPNNEVIGDTTSWTESVRRHLPFRGARDPRPVIDGSYQVNKVGGKYFFRGAWHSGLAWAATREALDRLGGLIDFAILGSADRHMAAGLFGFMEQTVVNYHPEYIRWLLDWQKRAERHIRRDVGQVDGVIAHHFHGRKKNRFYTERWKILTKHSFNPRTDIRRDAQGLWQLEDDGSSRLRNLRDDLRLYFRARNEDSIDL